MPRPSVVIVSPAAASANNGNWHTAHRWCTFISPVCDVRTVTRWPDTNAAHDDIMIALHARRSATSIEAWATARGSSNLALVLTGTDLYRDIAVDASARRSLELASHLVVLQELGMETLPAQFRPKARVIYQSVPARDPPAKPRSALRAVMVGHLRDVKSPETLFEAARILRHRADIRIDHIGSADEAEWAARAREAERDSPIYHWLGPMPNDDAREAIRLADVLVHTSLMEGGAHVIIEAVVSGTPVLASRIPGNIGMLGADYGGYFPHGDARLLAQLLKVCRAGQASDDPSASLLAQLRAQCALRAPLFEPRIEQAAVLDLVRSLQESP